MVSHHGASTGCSGKAVVAADLAKVYVKRSRIRAPLVGVVLHEETAVPSGAHGTASDVFA